MTNTPRPAPPDSRPGPAPAAPKVDGLLLEHLNDLFEQVMAQIFVAPHSNRMFNVMTGAQKRVLLLLALSGPLRMIEVAQRTGMAPSAASATLDGLEKLGLARRGPDPATGWWHRTSRPGRRTRRRSRQQRPEWGALSRPGAPGGEPATGQPGPPPRGTGDTTAGES